MQGFWNRDYDILVCRTTIIETGLDISNANTLIVERADAWACPSCTSCAAGWVEAGNGLRLLLYPRDTPLTETAHDRLATIAQNNELGAGMAVALKDLEIRGAGNVLGAEQSGHVAGVGFDLYVRLVGEAVEAYRAAADGKLVTTTEEPRTSASTCRSTRICRRITSAATDSGWRPTDGSPQRRTRQGWHERSRN